MDEPADRSAMDRRSFLAAAAGVAVAPTLLSSGAGAAGQSSGAGAAGQSLSVLTRNLYLGVDISGVADVESETELRRFAADLLADAREHPYGARMDAIADEIDSHRPAVVSVQEAARIRSRSDESADWTDVADLLPALSSRLADRGLSYRVASSTVTTDVTVTADAEEGTEEVRLTDRDALFVREDLTVEDQRSGRYETAIPVSVSWSDREFTLRRGYCVVDLAVGGRTVTVAGTHLESATPLIRYLQAEELIGLLPDSGPVVVAGDFNSGPRETRSAYDTLTRADAYADAWATADPGGAGDTCCHPASLRSESVELDARIDAVLYRGGLGPTAVERTGADLADRVAVTRDGVTEQLWPSDHAGVVVTFDLEWVTPTPSPTPSPTSSPTPSPSPTPTASPSPSPAPTPSSTATRTPTRTAGENTGPGSSGDGSPTDGSAGFSDPAESPGAGPSPRSSPDGATGGDGTGFGVVSGVLAIVLGALADRRRRE